MRVDGLNDKYPDILGQEALEEMLTPSEFSVNNTIEGGESLV